MKRHFRNIFLPVFITLFIIALGLPGVLSARPIVLKLGTKMPSDNPEGRAFQKFADLVKELTNGEVKVNVYPLEQLGKGTTQIDNVMLGTQDMYAEGSVYFSRFEKNFRIANIPYLFRDYDHFKAVMTGPIGKQMHANLIKKNLRVLNDKRNFRRGPYRVLCAKRPILSLDDVETMKMRIHPSDVYIAAWRHLGATTTIIPWTETYLAMKQNVVEAVASPISLVYSMKFTEVAPHVTVTRDYPQDIVIVMNNRKFNSLSKAHQQALLDAATGAGDYATSMIFDATEKSIRKMKKQHGAKFYEIDLTPFQNKMKDYFYELERKEFISAGLIDKILNTK